MAESEVVKAIRKQREEIARNELDTLRRMARLWAPSYKYLQEQVSALMWIIQAKQNKGEDVELEYIYSLNRYQTMMEQTAQTIRKYNKAIAGLINGAEAEATEIGKGNAQQLVSMAEPDHELWTRVNRRETVIAAGMTAEGSPLDTLLAKSWPETKERIESTLITGISTGQGSSWIADRIMEAVEIPERRALVIARTEVNRAYRQSNWEQMRSSRAVLGYRRMCYPPTACFACLMLDKEFYPVDSEPCDHPNGKCSFVPVTRHYDPANDSTWEGGREYFDALPEPEQRKLMGLGRFELWKQGGVDPRGMVWIKPNRVWGGSPAIRSLESMGYGTRGVYIKEVFRLNEFLVEGLPEDLGFEKRQRTDNPPIRKLLKSINRKYNSDATEDIGYKFNCQRAAVTWEMVRRNYRVKAKPNPSHNNDYLEQHYLAPFKGMAGKDFDYNLWKEHHKRCLSGNGKAEVEAAMLEWKSGSRAFVKVQWKDKLKAHVFIAENQNGTIRYFDPQTGNDDVSSYFDQVQAGKTEVTRVDNLEFTEYISECAEIVK